ncbi:MFS transporter [Rummeliibacillus pycnus]|uniref:MFS transporter n=1 Tax=Rummeliibacillus pycnus TaxID=101070 RepID=UPI0037C88235
MKQNNVSPSLTLLALAISAFAIGSTEFISVGLLPMIVETFNVSLAQAGLTVSLYALGVTVGAPLLTILTGQINRKKLMIGIMITFMIGNILAAVAINFPMLLAGRIISALAHGIFMSVSTVIAAEVVAPSKRASAIAIMFTGLTVATVTGVPLGTFIGQHMGWHFSFWFITIVGGIGLIADAWLIPKELPIPGRITSKGILRIFRSKELMFALLATAFGYGGTFAAYTYLSPLLEKYVGYSASGVVILLIVYGIMVAIGNTVGGKLANRNPLSALLKMFIGLLVALIFLFFTVQNLYLGTLAVLIMGIFAFMNVPGLQLYIVQLAEEKTPSDVLLASALNISAFNIGITLGASVGGQITSSVGLLYTPLGGVGMVFLAILLIIQLQRWNKTNANL